MQKGYDLRQHEVIDRGTAERLGFVSDVEIEPENGRISAIIVPRRRGWMRFLPGGGEYVIPWENVLVIGKEVILVENPEKCQKIAVIP